MESLGFWSHRMESLGGEGGKEGAPCGLGGCGARRAWWCSAGRASGGKESGGFVAIIRREGRREADDKQSEKKGERKMQGRIKRGPGSGEWER